MLALFIGAIHTIDSERDAFIAEYVTGRGEGDAYERALRADRRGRGGSGASRSVPRHVPGSFDDPTGEGVIPPPDLDPEVLEPWRDPQVHAFRRSFGGGDAGVALPFAPLEHSGRASTIRGLDLPPDATCDVRVLPVQSGGFNCVMRVTCGGQVVYPDSRERAGYVSCELEGGLPVRASDLSPSMRDGDPTVEFDARTGRVVVTESD